MKIKNLIDKSDLKPCTPIPFKYIFSPFPVFVTFSVSAMPDKPLSCSAAFVCLALSDQHFSDPGLDHKVFVMIRSFFPDKAVTQFLLCGMPALPP